MTSSCPDYTRSFFFLRKKTPASHRAQGGTPTTNYNYSGCHLLRDSGLPPRGMCVCVCVFIKLHITAQSGPVIYPSIILCYCMQPTWGLLIETYSWLEMRVHTATTPLPATTALGQNRKASFSPLGATNRDGNPTKREHHGQLPL